MQKTGVLILLVALLLWAVLPPVSGRAVEKEGVTFNFVDVDLSSVAKFISEVTGKNFIFDERLRGKVTIIAPSKLDQGDAFSLFTSVLKLKGFTLVPAGVNAFKIVPMAEARESGLDVSVDRPPINENFIARLIPLEHISAGEAVAFLKPMVSRTGYISSFGPGNFLFVVDSGLNIDKILDMVEVIDQPGVSEEPEVVFLENSDAEDVASILNQGLQKAGRKKPQQDQGKAVADRRLNAVILFGDKSTKDSMKRLIALIDVEAKEMQSAINVYFLENADAEQIASVIKGLVKVQPRKPVPGRPQAATPFESLSGIVITPDKATNSLVIVASPSDYNSIVQVIKQLDRKRKQVFVEAMIIEASLDKLKELGTRWRTIARDDGEPVFVAGVGEVGASTLNSIITGLSGFTTGGFGNFFTVPVFDPATGQSTDVSVPSIAGIFRLEEFKGVVEVLSSPQLLTSDNTEAEIIVGENVPFISKIERGLTAGDQAPFSSIERKDVGITLRITPQVTEGDYVNLDIFQEISSVQEASTEILTGVGPTTSKRSTSTTVVVQDGQTVIIGGLMQERTEDSVSRVPLLHRIPILGWLFKFKSTRREKTNLLVFITPHIIRDSRDLERLTGDKRREMAKREQMYAEDRLLVKFHDDVTEERVLDILQKRKAAVLKTFEVENLYLVGLKKGRDVKKELKKFEKFPEVEYAEPDYRISINGIEPWGGNIADSPRAPAPAP
jgi:general secretion pathway protein D